MSIVLSPNSVRLTLSPGTPQKAVETERELSLLNKIQKSQSRVLRLWYIKAVLELWTYAEVVCILAMLIYKLTKTQIPSSNFVFTQRGHSHRRRDPRKSLLKYNLQYFSTICVYSFSASFFRDKSSHNRLSVSGYGADLLIPLHGTESTLFNNLRFPIFWLLKVKPPSNTIKFHFLDANSKLNFEKI